jgi:hypothetical protein
MLNYCVQEAQDGFDPLAIAAQSVIFQLNLRSTRLF